MGDNGYRDIMYDTGIDTWAKLDYMCIPRWGHSFWLIISKFSSNPPTKFKSIKVKIMQKHFIHKNRSQPQEVRYGAKKEREDQFHTHILFNNSMNSCIW